MPPHHDDEVRETQARRDADTPADVQLGGPSDDPGADTSAELLGLLARAAGSPTVRRERHKVDPRS